LPAEATLTAFPPCDIGGKGCNGCSSPYNIGGKGYAPILTPYNIAGKDTHGNSPPYNIAGRDHATILLLNIIAGEGNFRDNERWLSRARAFFAITSVGYRERGHFQVVFQDGTIRQMPRQALPSD